MAYARELGRTEITDLLYAKQLFLALNNKNYAEIREVLANIENPNCFNDQGLSALLVAFFNDDLEAIQILLENEKIDPNLKHDNDWTIMLYALVNCKEEMFDLIFADRRTDPNVKEKEGFALLAYAIFNNNYEFAKKLILDDRTDINSFIGCQSRTPLTYAAELGRIQILQLFLEHGFDVKQKDAQQLTALETAQEFAKTEASELISNFLNSDSFRSNIPQENQQGRNI